MNRSSMPKQIMAFSNGGLASFIPRQTKIAGQPHMLAYINPQEEALLRDFGGSGIAGPGGIPSYPPESAINADYNTISGSDKYNSVSDDKPSGQSSQGGSFNTPDNTTVRVSTRNTSTGSDTPGGNTFSQTLANIFTPFDNQSYVNGELVDTTPGAGRDFDADMSAGSGTVYSSQDDDYTSDAGALPRDVGLIDSLLMGAGLKDKTAAYYSATADTIARTRGADAAAKYIDEMNAAGNLSDADARALKTSTAYTAQDAEDRGLLDSQQGGGDDNGSGSDQTGGDQTGGEEGDGDEDTGPPSSTNFRFFGGYQPRTREDVLVASPGADQPFVMPDDPRITPIFNPDDNIDEILQPTAIGPTEGYGGQLAADILATDYGPDPVGTIPEAATDVPVFGEEGTIAVPGSEAVVPDFQVPEFSPLTAQGGISAVEQNMIDTYGYTANPDGTISRNGVVFDSEQGGFLQGGTAAMTPAEILAQQQGVAQQASDLLAQQGGALQRTPEQMLQQIQETQARYITGAPGAPAQAFDFGAPANVGDTYFDPMTNTTYEYTEKPMGNTGQTYQGWDIKSGTGGQVGLYGAQPVDAAMNYGGGALAQGTPEEMVKRQGVASLMGGDPATEAMYQGIMS